MLKKIFFPQCCTRSPSGVLIGTSSADNTVLYVVAVVHFPTTPRKVNSYLASYEKLHDGIKLHTLGTWLPCGYEENDEFDLMIPKLFGQSSWMCIKMDKSTGCDVIFTAYDLTPRAKSILGAKEFVKSDSNVILVIYNQKDIWDGKLSEESLIKFGTDTSIENLFTVISTCKNGILSYRSRINQDEGIIITHCCMQRELSIVFYLVSIFVTVLLRFTHLLFNYFSKMKLNFCKPDCLFLKVCKKLVELSSFLTHIGRRLSDMSSGLACLFRKQTTTCDPDKSKDLVATVFADMILGCLLVWSLFHFNFLPYIGTTKEVFLPHVDSIARQVEELIEWLMGIPAGLKLNHPLNQFLGHFFLYHVRLWLEYAKMMMDVFPHLITYCLMSSCFGLSFLLCIIADAVSTLSFHVYCFYVYAGRLYGLQVSGLLSLWRLFRGKKWNPLRKRVDSLEESGQKADQLFAGTLLFTVLLFLLPTTALYYGIFMLLRVAVLAIQVWLSGLVFILSEFPWYSMFVRIIQPHKFIRSMKCSMINEVPDASGSISSRKSDQAMVFHMSVQAKSVGAVVRSALFKKSQLEEFTGFRTFLGNIIFGELIRWT